MVSFGMASLCQYRNKQQPAAGMMVMIMCLVAILSSISLIKVNAQSLSTIVPQSVENIGMYLSYQWQYPNECVVDLVFEMSIGNTIWYAGSGYASSRSRATDGPRNVAKFGTLTDITCVTDTTVCFVADTVSLVISLVISTVSEGVIEDCSSYCLLS
jgi:hypothetical protein